MAAARLALPAAHGGALVAHDFSALWHEKQTAHLPGTREWAFAEVEAWLDDEGAPRLFWLVGGGGTGKSVLSAELLRRASTASPRGTFAGTTTRSGRRRPRCSAASPRCCATRCPASRSGSRRRARRRPTTPRTSSRRSCSRRRRRWRRPGGGALLLIDALDELPKETQKPLLAVIAGQFSQLPAWLKLFVTSREEPQVKRELGRFELPRGRGQEQGGRRGLPARNRAQACQGPAEHGGHRGGCAAQV